MDRERFYASLRSRANSMFGTSLSQPQVNKIEAVLDGIEARGLLFTQAAYILGTAYHESDRFKTMEEYASGAAYEGREDLGNIIPGDGVRFKGRGLVQITGRRNYTDWSKRLGVDLVSKPELAASLQYAPTILIDGMMLGTFTGRTLPQYVNASKVDYPNARRTVNGTDRASFIAGYAQQFGEALTAAGYTNDPVPTPTPRPEVDTGADSGGDPKPSTGNGAALGIGAAVLAVVTAVASGWETVMNWLGF